MGVINVCQPARGSAANKLLLSGTVLWRAMCGEWARVCLSADDVETVIAALEQTILSFEKRQKGWVKLIREAGLDQLKRAVETQHGCTATVFQSVPVKETFGGKIVWEGVVYTFSLTGHPTARRAYAWSSSTEGGDKRRFFAMLHQWPVTSPVKAVRAAIMQEQRAANNSEA